MTLSDRDRRALFILGGALVLGGLIYWYLQFLLALFERRQRQDQRAGGQRRSHPKASRDVAQAGRYAARQGSGSEAGFARVGGARERV